MGFESFNSVPTKESLQSRIEDLKKQRENYANRLIQAQDTPVSNMFSEGEKSSAIKNHESMLEQIDAEMKKCEEEISHLN